MTGFQLKDSLRTLLNQVQHLAPGDLALGVSEVLVDFPGQRHGNAQRVIPSSIYQHAIAFDQVSCRLAFCRLYHCVTACESPQDLLVEYLP